MANNLKLDAPFEHLHPLVLLIFNLSHPYAVDIRFLELHVHGICRDMCIPYCHGYSELSVQYIQIHLGLLPETENITGDHTT